VAAGSSGRRFRDSIIHEGAYRFRPDGKKFRLRAVVGRLATLKVDRASIAEAQFSLAA
jgi:hypothetical protein